MNVLIGLINIWAIKIKRCLNSIINREHFATKNLAELA